MSDLTSADHDAIWDIMNNFDFHQIHRVMKLTQWGWYNPDCNSIKVPDIQNLRDTARRMLMECATRARKVGGQYTIGSGGFYVYAEYDPATGKVHQRLAFEIASWGDY